MGHTQTKLCISSESPKIIKCADFMGETSVIFASASGYNGSGFFPYDDEAPHNARRLVACWNACDGVPTDALEQIEGLAKSVLPYHQLKAQCDALLEALKAADEFIDGIRQDLHHERVADWYPEGAHNSAEAMSESMRLIGNRCADFVDASDAIAAAEKGGA